jgi:hypothetical protein
VYIQITANNVEVVSFTLITRKCNQLVASPEFTELLGDGDLNIDSGLDGDRGDLSHDLRRSVQIQDALVNAHLEAVVGVGTLTARRLADHQLQDLGGHADRAGHLNLLLLSLVLQHAADLLKTFNLGGRKGDSDLVHRSTLFSNSLGFNRDFRHFSLKFFSFTTDEALVLFLFLISFRVNPDGNLIHETKSEGNSTTQYRYTKSPLSVGGVHSFSF